MSKRVNLSLKLKRVYEAPAKSDGARILVDRMWPRGVSKDALQLSEWAKELAPSANLRKWFHHDPAKWESFKERYFRELDSRPSDVKRAIAKLRGGTTTLVFAAQDIRHNNAVALVEYLRGKLRGDRRRSSAGRSAENVRRSVSKTPKGVRSLDNADRVTSGAARPTTEFRRFVHHAGSLIKG